MTDDFVTTPSASRSTQIVSQQSQISIFAFCSSLPLSISPVIEIHRSSSGVTMAGKYIGSALLGSIAIAYISDNLIADQKIFGGTTPRTVSSKEWQIETDKKFQAWPRTAGPPVVMNPISRQNFIVKASLDQ